MDIASVTIFSGYGPANAVRTGMDVSNIVLMNDHGSYLWNCRSGFMLDNGRKHCDGK